LLRVPNSKLGGPKATKKIIENDFYFTDVGPAFETKDPAKFVKALNDIYVRGGKDCPEMSVTAIKLALELSLPGSVIYVFTDAEAKDHRMLPEVIRLIKQKNIRVNFILTGNCGLEKNFKGKNTYEKIAILSSGQIVNLNKSEVETIWEFVKISINPDRKNIYSVDKFSRGERTYIVKIDPNIREVIITGSGEHVEVIIWDSTGELVFLTDENVDVLLNLNSVVSVLVRNPRPGNWSITVRSNGRHTLRVEAISDRWEEVKGNHTVVVIPGTMYKRQFFSMSRICNEKCSKPKIFLAFLSKLLCLSFIL
jgi:hemicentin